MTATGSRSSTAGGSRGPAQRETLRTLAFDSKGDRKYALQIQKARNGNPCLRIVEGRPQSDGTYRKFDLVIWSEDWPAMFEALDDMRAFIERENIATPQGHSWKPGRANGSGRSKKG